MKTNADLADENVYRNCGTTEDIIRAIQSAHAERINLIEYVLPEVK